MNKPEDVIYRQAALDTIEKFSCCGYIEEDVDKLFKALNDLPPAQPEIIRCKDCKHRPIRKDGDIVPPKEDDWKCPCLCDDYYYSRIPRDDFFCANGERREE